MANWDILNKEFDDILNNISDDDWSDWFNNLDAQKEMCKMQMNLEANLQAQKLSFNKIIGHLIINETLTSVSIVHASNIIVSDDFYNYDNKSKRETDFPLAA